MKRYIFLLLFALQTVTAHSLDSTVVSDIRIEGLQRISAGSLFAALPINVGDSVDTTDTRNAIRRLFQTGNFDNVSILLDGSILVVAVEERPSISEINIDGNKVIETEALLDGLKDAGLAEGQVFKRSTLEGMKLELTSQYVSQGRYDAGIETDITSLPRNRVSVNINIDEGSTASIKHINIVGNSVYDDETLLNLFEMDTTNLFSWFTSSDKYAREKLSGDIETLSSYYLDRGYVKFNIESTQVSVTPDRESVYITVNISEGEKFTIDEVELSGDLVLPEAQLMRLVFVRKGQTFSQAMVTNTEEWLTKRLGNEGYNFAQVEGIPEINEEDNTVNLKFFIDPGKRTYVRRINFSGNTRTADEVLRREMRQMEAAPASASAIEQSKVRLERLGYFKQAVVETTEVPGSDDLIDLEYIVEEQNTGSIGASIGYSQDSGVLLGANLEQNNFLGTGKNIGVGISKSDYLSSANFSYVDPYYTKDGVSRGFSVFYRELDLDAINVSSYNTNSFGTSVNFSYPIKETERLGFSFGYTNTQIETGSNAVQEIIAGPRFEDPITFNGVDYYSSYYEDLGSENIDTDGDGVDDTTVTIPVVVQELYDSNGNIVDDALSYLINTGEEGFIDKNGDTFNNFSATISWNQSTLNRGVMATRGYSQSLSLEATIPGSDLQYFKLTYRGERYFPLTRQLTLRLRGEFGYGDGYGDTDGLPFFNNFYAGGFGSVRGFESNTLGPRSTPAIRYNTASPLVGYVAVGGDDCFSDVDGDGLCDGSGSVIGSAIFDDDYAQSYYIDRNTGLFSASTFDFDPDPFGGNVLIESSAEVIFPLPFIEDQRSIRSVFFFDAGNVFNSACGSSQLNCFKPDFDELRYSYGIGISWITGFGPLSFSYSRPINESETDEVQNFQFTMGRTF